MKIEDGRLQPMRYVDGGDVFEFNGRKYMRLSTDSKERFNAVDVEDGELAAIDADAYVQTLRNALLAID